MLGLKLNHVSKRGHWLQWLGQKQMQDTTRLISVSTFGATYIRDLTHQGLVTLFGIMNFDNNGSGNGLMPDRTKP